MSNPLRDIFWFISMERNRREIYLLCGKGSLVGTCCLLDDFIINWTEVRNYEGGVRRELGWRPLVASSGTMGRSPRFMGISFSLDTNVRIRLSVHGTRTPNDPLTSASFTRKRRSRWERSGVRGDTQGWVGVQKKLNDTRPCLLALLTTRCSVQCARLTFDRMDDEDRVEQSFAKKFVSHDLVYYHARWRYF